MVGMPIQTTVTVNRTHHTLHDVTVRSLYDVRTSGELEWTVIAYACYLEPDVCWINKYGEEMSLAILTRALWQNETRTCGGTHRLTALARAAAAMSRSENPDTRQLCALIAETLAAEAARLQSVQQTNGRFAEPETFRGLLDPENGVTDQLLGVYYTGHSLEWIANGMSSDELRGPLAISAVRYLVDTCQQECAKIQPGMAAPSEIDNFALGILSHAASGIEWWLARTGTSDGL